MWVDLIGYYNYVVRSDWLDLHVMRITPVDLIGDYNYVCRSDWLDLHVMRITSIV